MSSRTSVPNELYVMELSRKRSHADLELLAPLFDADVPPKRGSC